MGFLCGVSDPNDKFYWIFLCRLCGIGWYDNILNESKIISGILMVIKWGMWLSVGFKIKSKFGEAKDGSLSRAASCQIPFGDGGRLGGWSSIVRVFYGSQN